MQDFVECSGQMESVSSNDCSHDKNMLTLRLEHLEVFLNLRLQQQINCQKAYSLMCSTSLSKDP